MHASGSGAQRAGACVIPFGGGKGGVGKTFLVANLATALAQQGHRVVAVDGDLEGANLHTCLGVLRPRASLADYVAHREEDLQKLLLDTHLPNLALIAATRSHLGSAQPSHSRRVQLLRALRALPADFVLLDLGAGLHPAVMDYFMVGRERRGGDLAGADLGRERLRVHPRRLLPPPASGDGVARRAPARHARDGRAQRAQHPHADRSAARDPEPRRHRGGALRRDHARLPAAHHRERGAQRGRREARLLGGERVPQVFRRRSGVHRLREPRRGRPPLRAAPASRWSRCTRAPTRRATSRGWRASSRAR